MPKSTFDILRNRYPESEYALMKEVSDKAGFERSRSADFIAVSLWPSRGCAISGFELKSFRSDWLSELKNPRKAENIFQYCDHFWLLTSDESVAKMEEIPVSWGWMNIKNEKIYIKKPAPKLEPKPINNNFVACLLKRAQDKTGYVEQSSIQDKIDEEKEKHLNAYIRSEEYSKGKYEKLLADVFEFEKASGIKLTHAWGDDATKMGEAVKTIRNGGVEPIMKELKELEETANDIAKKITQRLKILTELTPKEPTQSVAINNEG